jgi:hypothetical protein
MKQNDFAVVGNPEVWRLRTCVHKALSDISIQKNGRHIPRRYPRLKICRPIQEPCQNSVSAFAYCLGVITLSITWITPFDEVTFDSSNMPMSSSSSLTMRCLPP